MNQNYIFVTEIWLIPINMDFLKKSKLPDYQYNVEQSELIET